jgi:hypothetical protein
VTTTLDALANGGRDLPLSAQWGNANGASPELAVLHSTGDLFRAVARSCFYADVLRVPDMGGRPCCLVWASQDGSARVFRHVQRQLLAGKKQNNRMSGVDFVVDNVGEH